MSDSSGIISCFSSGFMGPMKNYTSLCLLECVAALVSWNIPGDIYISKRKTGSRIVLNNAGCVWDTPGLCRCYVGNLYLGLTSHQKRTFTKGIFRIKWNISHWYFDDVTHKCITGESLRNFFKSSSYLLSSISLHRTENKCHIRQHFFTISHPPSYTAALCVLERRN